MLECIDKLSLGFGIRHKEQGEEERGVGNGAVLESKGDDVAKEAKLKAEVAVMKAEVARKDEKLRKKEVLSILFSLDLTLSHYI